MSAREWFAVLVGSGVTLMAVYGAIGITLGWLRGVMAARVMARAAEAVPGQNPVLDALMGGQMLAKAHEDLATNHDRLVSLVSDLSNNHDQRLSSLEDTTDNTETIVNEHDARLLALESHVELKWEGP